MYDALVNADTPVAMRLYPGEAHGFRSPAVRQDAIETELAFYGDILGFTPHEVDIQVPYAARR